MSHTINKKNIIIMILMGSVLETYDYSVYGYFAAIISQQFFPAYSPTSSLLITFSVFALGFVARPIGALIFGNYGDKLGRKKMLIITIMMMAIPTACIGLLPTYASIGIFAGLLLTLCRLIQGVAVGAEFVGTMVYMVELAPQNKKGLYGSLCICSGYFSMLLSAAIFALLSYYLPTSILHAWGWRLPFLFGLVLGCIGFILRSRLPETNAFKLLQANNIVARQPLIQLFKEMPLQVLKGTGLSVLHVVGFYILFVYLSSYLSNYYQLSAFTNSIVNFVTIICATCSLPIFGMMADRFNKRPLIILSSSITMLTAYSLFLLINQQTFMSLLMMEVCLALLVCMTSAVLPAFLASLFPTQLRFTGMALSYNIAAVLFGGTAPLFMTLLVEKTGSISLPSYYLTLAAMLTLVCVLISRRQYEG